MGAILVDTGLSVTVAPPEVALWLSRPLPRRHAENNRWSRGASVA